MAEGLLDDWRTGRNTRHTMVGLLQQSVFTVETAGEGGGDADGLRGSPMSAPTQGVLGDIMAWQRSDTPSAEQKECLVVSRSAIDLPERLTAVVGWKPSGKSRLSCDATKDCINCLISFLADGKKVEIHALEQGHPCGQLSC